METVFKIGCLFFFATTLFGFIIGGMSACTAPHSTSENDSLSQDTLLHDSLEAETAEVKNINIDSIVNVFRPDFIFKKDEFENRTWIEPKNRPKYTNTNRIYCYFQLTDNTASNFRLRIQYASDDWLFIENFKFNIDGNRNITFVPEKMERDNDSSIWEWCDEHIDTEYKFLISALAHAKKAKVKFEGQQYYNTRNLTPEELKYIKKTYEFYLALGGKF